MATIETRDNDDGVKAYRVKIRLKGHPTQYATFARLTDAKKWGNVPEPQFATGAISRPANPAGTRSRK
jgi:hypothetical protein